MPAFVARQDNVRVAGPFLGITRGAIQPAPSTAGHSSLIVRAVRRN
jgi:hypothetical protein